MVAPRANNRIAEISELSAVIGELRSFSAQQAVTNIHMLDEIKKISERMTVFGEIGATFVEYRKTLHERFGKIQEQVVSIDVAIEKLDHRSNEIEQAVSVLTANWKMILSVLYIASTITGALVSTYGGTLLKAVTH